MFYYSYSMALHGMEAYVVHVEADVSDGLPIFSLVGLLGSEVREAKDRVRISIRNSGYQLPVKRITINLSPADIKKEGTGFDLAIAVSLLSACGYVPQKQLEHILLIGELSLDGTIQAVTGILPMVYAAKQKGFHTCLIPIQNQIEGDIVKGVKSVGVKNLNEVVIYLNEAEIHSYQKNCIDSEKENRIDIKRDWNEIDLLEQMEQKTEEVMLEEELDFSDVVGQESLKKGLEVAAAAKHNLLMVGPPGAGKTMLAKRIQTILPKLTLEEAMEISKIYSIAGLLEKENPLILRRPFRAPHHTITPTALVGGGRVPKPGELSLAMGGILFLDELPEFKRETLEVLRQPLEEKFVFISRVQGSYRYPADFMLIAAMNPCHCGYYPNKNRCSCTSYQIQQYLAKISRPLLDRIDITVEATELTYQELYCKDKGESSETIKKRVIQARNIQIERYKKEKITYNSQLSPSLIETYCPLEKQEERFLENTFQQLKLSARAYHKILKVARTIADLEASERITTSHLAQAVSYRTMEVGI